MMSKNIVFEEELDNPHISKYWIEVCSSGITHLVINTKERWIDYGIIWSNEGVKISVEYMDYSKDDPHCMDIITLKFQKPANTIQLEQQNKDQISVYYIPYELLDINVKKG